MKSKIIWIIIILVIVIAIFASCTSKNNNGQDFKPVDLNIGDIFSEISYQNQMYVVNYEVADITGDGKKDMVIIVGEKENVEDTFSKNMDVVVYDNANQTFINTGLKNFCGNNTKLQTGDYTGDGISDVLILTQNDDGTYSARIVTYTNTKLSEIFKDRNNKGLIFEGKFIDGFKVNVMNRKLNKEFTIELSDRKDNYIKNGFYDESGKLKTENTSISTSNFTSVEPVLLNDRYGIKTTQRITGFDNLDIIDEVEVVWKYEDGKWQMKEAKGTKIGNLLY